MNLRRHSHRLVIVRLLLFALQLVAAVELDVVALGLLVTKEEAGRVIITALTALDVKQIDDLAVHRRHVAGSTLLRQLHPAVIDCVKMEVSLPWGTGPAEPELASGIG
jgi:hypothetical protein